MLNRFLSVELETVANILESKTPSRSDLDHFFKRDTNVENWLEEVFISLMRARGIHGMYVDMKTICRNDEKVSIDICDNESTIKQGVLTLSFAELSRIYTVLTAESMYYEYELSPGEIYLNLKEILENR